ncbi:MAG: phosphoadenylyl-sulfate reductase [Planctomycetaceae bacterium]
MARLIQAELADLNKAFEKKSPQELLRWAKDTFGDRVSAISSMQKSGCAVCHMLHSEKIDMPVLFVDTGVMFEESLETRDRIAGEYGLNITTLSPKQSMVEQTVEHGILYLTPEGQKQCCDLRKTQPLADAADSFDALVGSLRRSDGGKRETCPVLAIDPRMNCLRINPLVLIDDDQLTEYLGRHNVITNPLHDQGFATIGCNRCTTPVLPNEPRRAGRWRHLGPWSVYCGINPTDLDPAKAPAVNFSPDLIDKILGREQIDFMI